MNHHTLLGQILQMFPRFEFQKAVKETKTEYHARGFTSWNHFTAMLFGQLSGQDSLRGIEAGLATNVKALYHLGIKPIHRSTLSYANEHRSHELFKKIFFFMLSKCQPLAPKHKFRFKNPLYSLDASIINLCLSLYNWAKFRTTKGAVKLHVKLNHSGYLPSFAVITNGNVHEQKVAPSIPLEKGDVIAFDRAYNSLLWLKTLDNKGVFFVTRLKKMPVIELLKEGMFQIWKTYIQTRLSNLKASTQRKSFLINCDVSAQKIQKQVKQSPFSLTTFPGQQKPLLKFTKNAGR